MLKVGVTGGVGSGKSSVARMLGEHGAAVRDADAVVRRLYLPGGGGSRIVAELFGESVLTAAGGVDHASLAAAVLTDPEARRRLEQAVHPLVRAEIDVWIGALADLEDPPCMAVVEAALLVETGSYRSYDRLVVVTAATALRRARSLAAGWPEATLDRVLAAQTDDTSRESVADYVVRNDGTVGALRAAVGELWLALRADAALVAAGRPLPQRRA